MYILRFLRPNLLLILLVIFALLLTAVSVTSLGATVKSFIDHGMNDASNILKNKSILYFLGFSVLFAISSGLRVFSVNLLAVRLVSSIKRATYEKILHFKIPHFDKEGMNIYKTFLTSDIDEAVESVTSKLAIIVRNVGLFIGGFGFLLFSNVKLTFIMLLAIALIISIISAMGMKLRKKITNVKNLKNGLFKHFSEAISFIKFIKIASTEDFEVEKLSKEQSAIMRNSKSLFIFRGVFIFIIIFALMLMVASIMFIGGGMIKNGTMTAGVFSSFIFYSILCSISIGGIIEAISEISKYKPNFKRIGEILSSNESASSGTSCLDMDEMKFQSMEFKNINFIYNESEGSVLNDISFKIDRGEKVTIIGPSGSGKSTILNLMLRFYSASNGEILVNGSNINDIDCYYKLFAYISQDVPIFSDSLYYNLTYGIIPHLQNDRDRDPLIMSKLNTLIDKFNLRQFINDLQNGLDTVVGDKALQLSGGQRQRVAIIRALMSGAQILIMDEATSALDIDNEHNVYDLLFSDEYKDLTIIFITHRLSNLKMMDKIIIINKEHEIAKIGTYEDIKDMIIS